LESESPSTGLSSFAGSVLDFIYKAITPQPSAHKQLADAAQSPPNTHD
jgi:hypothetical protein